MKLFHCPNCGHIAFFESAQCEQCRSALGFHWRDDSLVAIASTDGVWPRSRRGSSWFPCANAPTAGCNWLVESTDSGSLCAACRLNRTIPPADTVSQTSHWRTLESNKRRLYYSLKRLGIPPIDRSYDPKNGLCFDFLSSGNNPSSAPVTGHANGVITINVGEVDPANREATRAAMNEPYRTVIGHFRHEVGHHYWERIVQNESDALNGFRQVFGDERTDYAQALNRHHELGPPTDWSQRFISAYASCHPWEDWAESWAHYLHLLDAMETAYAFQLSFHSLRPNSPEIAMQPPTDPYATIDFDQFLADGANLAIALNCLNRGMGHPDFYPFAPSVPALEKLTWIHHRIQHSRR